MQVKPGNQYTASTRISLCFESSGDKKKKEKEKAETAAAQLPAFLPLPHKTKYNTTAHGKTSVLLLL